LDANDCNSVMRSLLACAQIGEEGDAGELLRTDVEGTRLRIVTWHGNDHAFEPRTAPQWAAFQHRPGAR